MKLCSSPGKAGAGVLGFVPALRNAQHLADWSRQARRAVLRYVFVLVSAELKSSGYRWPVCLIFFLFLSFIFSLTPSAKADTLEDAARQLGQKIAAALPSYVPSFLSVQNLSSLSEGQVTSVRNALQAALEKTGFKLSSDRHSLGQIHVTLSESLTGYVWIAEVRRGEAFTVLMVWFNSGKLRRIQTSASLAIRREFLWEQEQPILDVAFFPLDTGPRHMYVLESAQVFYYDPQSDGWSVNRIFPLPRILPVQRDPRGFLGLGIDSMVATFQGESCHNSMRPGEGMFCERSHADANISSLGAIAARDNKSTSWFSHAKVETDGRSIAIKTGIDGLLRLYEEGLEPVAAFSGWGSEIASIKSGCGSGWQLLVTGKGDWTAPDMIQAFEIRDRQAVAASAAMEFSGPVTALHSSEDSKTAIAVVKNLTTHHYEAYRLSITCER